ncbi:MAG: glycosidase [Muribaculaceae bacterium]|uniref:alpha-amylase family protein n=1 Tax=uncultured Duncaniella sp. TaxID=2768039 RepID=UPI002619E552|nr:alpha-amylase family protein [uncultured Duncaniella sp.]MCI8999180.1 glycosidase [Muribaculaceae bacterium]
MKLKIMFFAFLASIFGGSAVAAASDKPDARSLSIYQIMVASFQHDSDGAPGYQAMWGPDDAIKNGNLRGVINALDHIKSLGVNAIWMTPIFDSSIAEGGEKLQATGYFTNDYFKIDPHFGTEADFRELVDEAHKRGLYVILDGVFGHHGGVTAPSPKGNRIDTTRVFSDRGEQGGTGNVAYPGSLEYFKELATYWIDKYGVDGWRLDQAYQATQNGHNYWLEIKQAVDSVTASRRARGEEWGILGYMVGEDWGTADVINRGVYKDGGLDSAFDFDGKELISGPMQELTSEGLENGWADVITVLSPPTARGYLNDSVQPNLFLSNHDGYRLADHFDSDDSYFYQKLMTRNAILAAYSGPITLYYGDEYADLSRNSIGAQKDNIARTTGHLEPRNPKEEALKNYISDAMRFRADNPAMWRGDATFYTFKPNGGGEVLVVTKTDVESGNKVVVIFSDVDVEVPVAGVDAPVKVSAWVPEFVKVS